MSFPGTAPPDEVNGGSAHGHLDVRSATSPGLAVKDIRAAQKCL
ncbi:hypothetical protein [Corynebacterium glucuronolyticum]|nr:hypothetical protein [Corynebacterium glucuronolyticum]EEI27313.1 hypothetical protein HMPREF0294_1289 [Corynebacterium glucuronolyticum ATCC 51867]